jgi:very-short-patch-repair endonuclease
VRVAGYEVDVLFRQQRVIVELDGYDFHAGRAAFERDRERDANLLAAGYRTIRITWERLQRAPEREAARIMAILNAGS